MIKQLGYLGLGVKDSKTWEDFAKNVLALDVSEKLDDGTLYLRQDEYHHRFIIEPTGEEDLKYVGFMVATQDDMNEIQARVEADGVRVEEGTPEECAHRKVHNFISFDDPDGLRVEVFLGLDVIVDKNWYAPRPFVGRWVTDDMGLGHILVNTLKADVDEVERFYRDVLGFKISDYIWNARTHEPGEQPLVFMHVNSRHHSFAICKIPMMPTRLTHWMMQASEIEDVGRTLDIVKERGIPVRVELGKHSNDQMTSFYFATPSEWSVEVGWGGRKVDDSTWVVQQYHQAGREFWGHQGLGSRPQPWEQKPEFAVK